MVDFAGCNLRLCSHLQLYSVIAACSAKQAGWISDTNQQQII